MSFSNGAALKGFQNPTFDATTVFRKVLEVMSRPGQVEEISDLCEVPQGLNATTAALLLSLTDMETPVWLDTQMNRAQVRDFLNFHTGCRIVDGVEEAHFLVADVQTPTDCFENVSVGTAEFPDRSATLLIAVPEMAGEGSLMLRGPGIQHECRLSLPSVPKTFWQWRAEKNSNFPCGIDLIFAGPKEICALPRTTEVEF